VGPVSASDPHLPASSDAYDSNDQLAESEQHFPGGKFSFFLQVPGRYTFVAKVSGRRLQRAVDAVTSHATTIAFVFRRPATKR
jgi:hypothetical protein